MFKLSREEFEHLRSQIVTFKLGRVPVCARQRF